MAHIAYPISDIEDYHCQDLLAMGYVIAGQGLYGGQLPYTELLLAVQGRAGRGTTQQVCVGPELEPPSLLVP